ncbi:hypothetical protein HAX54_012518 [Datura stramonium]|uniref:Uncharacterized protein n=1 Tax=Datura stramonium TaxID=4076 RepID=A0ABS8RXQ8_DATST|nr:hypothetical protein [Datura stramonium]
MHRVKSVQGNRCFILDDEPNSLLRSSSMLDIKFIAGDFRFCETESKSLYKIRASSSSSSVNFSICPFTEKLLGDFRFHGTESRFLFRIRASSASSINFSIDIRFRETESRASSSVNFFYLPFQ